MLSRSLITCPKEVIFVFPILLSGAISVRPFLAKMSVAQEVFHPLLCLSTQLQNRHTLTPPSLHPALFHTALGLAETPVCKPPPPFLHSYQPGVPRTERRKEPKKELHLSVRDYRLSLSADHLASTGSCLHTAEGWLCSRGARSYNRRLRPSLDVC